MIFKPQKGKAFDKLPQKTLNNFNTTSYVTSVKFDGNQIFICKRGDKIRWFTSDWKEFNLPQLGLSLAINNPVKDFDLVAEFNYNTIGKLGDRHEASGKLATERANFRNGKPCSLDESKIHIKVFDYLSVENDKHTNLDIGYINKLESSKELKFPYQIQLIEYSIIKGINLKDKLKEVVNKGWEGLMAVETYSVYEIGKRVNHSIKLKDRPTADLKCIGYKPGEDSFEGMVGSLHLVDSYGREVFVSSGLEFHERDLKYFDENFKDRIIEISYEQIADTYLQPVYNCIRLDKTKGE